MSSSNFKASSIWGKKWVWWLPLHNLHENLTLLFFFLVVSWLVDGRLAPCCSEADNMGWWGCVDHASITLDRPGKSLRRWLPLQILQGYLGLWVIWGILASSTLPTWLLVTSSFPKCRAMVGIVDPCLFFFFLIFLFFFFLFNGLLASELSLSEEDETEEDLACDEG